MKLTFPEVQVESSTNFITESFDVGDKRIIMEILRSKMYTDPIYTICQEIMSNSRDANREVGKADQPIIVKFPNDFDESIRFQDFGPGITPDRMSNIFLKYGNSTKRNDDEQIGGFGLGAKTPFAYADTFTIITITPDGENGQLIKREYVSFVDESRLGAMSLVREEIATEDSTGTTIVVPVKVPDRRRFEMAAVEVSFFWDVRPVFVHTKDLTWPEIEWSKFEEKRWGIVQRAGALGGYRTLDGPSVIVDGIPYPLDTSVIFKGVDKEDLPHGVSNLLAKPLKLFFKTGEVKVTANREGLDYQDDVLQVLRDRITEILGVLRKEAESLFDGVDNFWAAVLKWRQEEFKFDGLYKPKWDGHELIQAIEADYSSDNYIKIHLYQVINLGDNAEVIRKKRERYDRPRIEVRSDVLLTENDEKPLSPSIPRLVTLARRHHHIRWIGVVKFIGENQTATAIHESFKKQYTWDKMGAIPLSTIPRTIVRTSNGNSGITIPKVKTLSGDKWEPADAEDDDYKLDTGSGPYLVLKGGRAYWTLDEAESERNGLYAGNLRDLTRALGEVRGVFARWVPKLGTGWVPMKDWLNQRIEELTNDPEVQAALNVDPFYVAEQKLESMYHFLKKRLTQLSESSELRKYMEMSEVDYGSVVKLRRLNSYRSLLSKSQLTPSNTKLMNQFHVVERSYPLLGAHISNWNLAPREDSWMYIMAKDAWLEEQAKLAEQKRAELDAAAAAEAAAEAERLESEGTSPPDEKDDEGNSMMGPMDEDDDEDDTFLDDDDDDDDDWEDDDDDLDDDDDDDD